MPDIKAKNSAPCPHFGPCGGCSRQDVSYEQQLADKETFVRESLNDLPIGEFKSILPSPSLFFYRNKMEYSFGDVNDVEILTLGKKTTDGERPVNNVHLGLHPKGRFALVTPTPDCLLLSNESQVILKTVATWATEHRIPVYVRKKNRGVLRHLVIREGKNTGERMVNLVATSNLPFLDELAGRLEECGVPITTLLWTVHDGLSDVALGQSTRILWGGGQITERLARIHLRMTPTSFMQTNTAAAELMIRLLREWAERDRTALTKRGTLFDLYCGSGAIGLNLAEDYEKMIGIEINKEAVQDARANALKNNLANAEFQAGKLEDVIGALPLPPAEETTVVVDPPRAGLHSRVVESLLRWGAASLYYVSCNPVSLANDLKALEARYSILTVQPMDFFPHTNHVETAVRMRLKE